MIINVSNNLYISFSKATVPLVFGTFIISFNQKVSIVKRVNKIIKWSQSLITPVMQLLTKVANLIIGIPIGQIIQVIVNFATGVHFISPRIAIGLIVRQVKRVNKIIQWTMGLATPVMAIIKVTWYGILNLSHGMAVSVTTVDIPARVFTFIVGIGQAVRLSSIKSYLRSFIVQVGQIVRLLPIMTRLKNFRTSIGQIVTISHGPAFLRNFIVAIGQKVSLIDRKAAVKSFRTSISSKVTLFKKLGKFIVVPISQVVSLIKNIRHIITVSISQIVSFVQGRAFFRTFIISVGQLVTLFPIKAYLRVFVATIGLTAVNFKSINKPLTIAWIQLVLFGNKQFSKLFTLLSPLKISVNVFITRARIFMITMGQKLTIIKSISKRIVVAIQGLISIIGQAPHREYIINIRMHLAVNYIKRLHQLYSKIAVWVKATYAAVMIKTSRSRVGISKSNAANTHIQ
jgi:hypothetical protein